MSHDESQGVDLLAEFEQLEEQAASSDAAHEAALSAKDANYEIPAAALESLNVHLDMLGLEAIAPGKVKSAIALIKNKSLIQNKLFGKFFERLKIALDATQTRKLEALRKQLEMTSGDISPEQLGKIRVRAPKAGAGLSMNGVLIKNPSEAIDYTHKFVVALLGHTFTHSSQVAKALAQITDFEKMPRDADDFNSLVLRFMRVIDAAGDMYDFVPTDILRAELPGNRRVFVDKTRQDQIRLSSRANTIDDRAMIDRLESFTAEYNPRGAIGRGGGGDFVPAMNREQCLALIASMDLITNSLRSIFQTYNLGASDYEPHIVGEFMEVVRDYCAGEIYVDERGDRWTTEIELDREDLVRADWIVQYCSQSVVSPRKCLNSAAFVMTDLFESCHEYILASMKQFR